MKLNNIFKYIFIIFVIGIIIYAGYLIYNNNNNKVEEEKVITKEETVIIKDIRLAVTGYDSINPLITNNKEILNIDTLIFEPLFKITNDYKLEACLATECSKTGDNTYIIKINNNINWQDGTSVIAKDIQFTIDKLKEGNSVYKNNVEHVIEVQVIDASTVKIILDADVEFFEYNLTFPILSSTYYYDEDFFSSSKIPIGTGQYKIEEINNNTIILSKNEKWKKISTENSKIETIKINIYSSMGEVFNSFKLGNIDLLNTSNKNYQEYIGTLGYNIKEYPGRQFDFLSFNCQDQILQDKVVRKALSYAIDKDNIISTVFNNQYISATYPLDYGNYLYKDDNSSSGYNIEQAKKVLEEGQWIYSNNKWSKKINGVTQKLRLKISVNKENEQRVRVAELIQEQLNQIGIEIIVEKISNTQYQEYMLNKNYQILLTGVYNSYSPDLKYYFSEGNIENYYSEDMLSIINNVDLVKDSNTLNSKYQKIYNLYKEDLPFIGLYRDKNITVSSQLLTGEITPNNNSTFYNFSAWYRK